MVMACLGLPGWNGDGVGQCVSAEEDVDVGLGRGGGAVCVCGVCGGSAGLRDGAVAVGVVYVRAGPGDPGRGPG